MYRTANESPPKGADYLIVLGAKVNGSDMSLSLYNRVEAALRYLNVNPKTKVIVTGGKGPGEDIAEAKTAETYFLNNGIPSSRILKEDKSTSTFENFLYTKKLISPQARVVIVSNDFHLFRAKMVASRLGYSNAHTLAAATPNAVKIQTYTREYAAILKSFIIDRP
ncbi:YdcF family protein [Bacillus songklensis]|uniref:YdcF family protein n=2 Tax=Bacillus songklensis TaxID=1069116 RepID=A0ABV8B7E3_9BACI